MTLHLPFHHHIVIIISIIIIIVIAVINFDNITYIFIS